MNTIVLLQATPASAAKTPRSSSKSSKSSSKKQPKGKASAVATIEVFRNQSLAEFGPHAFMRRITNMITPEVISRIDNKWYAAVNKGSLGSMLRAAVLTCDIGCYGAIYDQMRAVEPKHEADIIRRFTRTGQHAGRDHREQVAKIVASPFAKTNDMEMEHVKHCGNQCSACPEERLSWGTIILLFKPCPRRKQVSTTWLCDAICMSSTLSAPTLVCR